MPPFLVFDLDGTLIHSIPDLTVLLNRLLARHKRRPLSESEVTRVVGEGVAKALQRAFRMTGEELETSHLEACVQEYKDMYVSFEMTRTHPFAGVPETLETLRQTGFSMAVCTNKPEIPARQILDKLNLASFFTGIIGAETTPARKPDPAPLFAAIASGGGDPGRAVMIGDSPTDLETAKNAGIPCLLATYGYSREPVKNLNAASRFDRFSDLTGLLATFS